MTKNHLVDCAIRALLVAIVIVIVETLNGGLNADSVDAALRFACIGFIVGFPVITVAEFISIKRRNKTRS